MLEKGDRAPDFDLEDETGTRRRLHDLLSEGPIVLYFYPADFTPVCTRQACMFRDVHTELVDAGVRVFGVSPQSAESHRRFRARHALPFPLLADPEKSVAKAYGAEGPFGIGVRRVSYSIAADGTIDDVVVADLRVGRHRDLVERLVAGSRGGPTS